MPEIVTEEPEFELDDIDTKILPPRPRYLKGKHDLVVMVARGSWRNYQMGFDLLQGISFKRGGVVTGRLHRVGGVSRDRMGDFGFKEAFH